MMNDLIIKVEKSTRMVILPKTIIGNENENLQEKLIFKFTDTFVNGQGRVEYKIGNDKYYLALTKENESYTLPIKDVITKKGKINMQLVITEGTDDEEIPVFKSNEFYFYCNESINAVDEAPSSYDLWIEQANAKLNAMDEALTEVDNLDIDVSKTGNTATVEITQKDGTTKSVQITDGTNGTNGVDGKDGKDGVDGINGTDGISPTATISKSGNTATITITDKNGTTTATVSDGTNGTNGTNGRDGYVQYTAGENITIENNVISATGGGSGVPEEVESGDYVGTIQNLGNQMSLQINYDNDSRINIIDFQDGLTHIGADASDNGETNTADMYLDATSSYGSLGTYTSDANATATISIDADDTNAYEQIQLSSGVVDISANTYDGNGDAENQTSLYVDATSQTIYYTAPNGFKGQTPVANDDIATKGYVDGMPKTKVYNIDYNATNNEYVSYFTQWIDDLKNATPVVVIIRRDYSITTGEIRWNSYSEGNGTLQLTTGFCWGAGTSSAYGVSYRNSGFMGRTATVTNDTVASVASWFTSTDGSAITGASNLLGVNNTTAYSVTSDYNPAHKKYVDDAIANAITGALGGSY